MSEQPTCGHGLAANANLPAAMGSVLAGMAQNLDAHQAALDPGDPAARAELRAYLTLVAEQELLELLQARIERDRAMLETITAHVRRTT
jgi:formiminotetrahydrofolate cyclodeaminase